MKRFAVLILFACLVGASSLIGAIRLTAVEPTMASPGASLVASGTELTEVDLLFLTVDTTDIPVEITSKTAEEIRFKLPADVAHGQYRLMIQTGGDVPALMVQPITCEVMSAAEITERQSQLEKEERRIDAAASPTEETPPAK
ncbi:MAG: hypothetical protein O3A53_09780 [Acidobacteria bacterium]|nr:hypothetical protein [Acidobacteriota bacterium]MDA1235081.1 hypothetical protein [Acidobacteriota bacterium]